MKRSTNIAPVSLSSSYLTGSEFAERLLDEELIGVMYANAIHLADKEKIAADGFLKNARWVSHKKITAKNRIAMGKQIFRLQCASCHSIGGPMNDILPLTRKFSRFGMDAQLNGQGKLLDYMPPFMGTAQERDALARYIVQGLHAKKEKFPIHCFIIIQKLFGLISRFEPLVQLSL